MIIALWRHFAAGVSALRGRRRGDAELDEEIAGYVEEAVAAHRARGLSAPAARRAALLELGGAVQLREQVRGHGWENAVEDFWTDLRHGSRRLTAAPGFAVAAIFTLALGVGGATAIFSAVRPVLFDPLPYPDADRIRAVWEVNGDGSRADGTFGMYRALAERAHGFESLAVFSRWQPTWTGGETAERLDGQRVSAGYFAVLGVAPALGRDFIAADDVGSAPAVAIVSHSFGQRRGRSDAEVLGTHVSLDGREYTVVGVMSPSFENVLAPEAQVWTTLQYEAGEGRAWGHHLRTVGRLRGGITPAAAQRELNAIARDVIATERPSTYRDDVVWIAPSLGDDVAAVVRPALLAMLGAVALLLVMAFVSVANLLLARGVRRQPEFALRLALGARPGRIVWQILAESLVLAVAAGGAAALIAGAGVNALVALAPAGVPRVETVTVDWRALLAGVIAAAALTALFDALSSLPPNSRRGEVARPGARSTAGLPQRRTRSALVVAQVAIALVLLCGAGLLLRSVQQLLAVPPGFSGAGAVALQVQLSAERYADAAALQHYQRELEEAVAAVPGVRFAGVTSQLPLSGDHNMWGVHFESTEARMGENERGAFRYAVTPGYLRALGVPLRSGRLLADGDRAGVPGVALINESLARRRFPDGEALGQRLRIGPYDSEPFTVVGIVGDVTHETLALGVSDAVYVPSEQWRFADRVVTLVVREEGDVAALIPSLRAAIRDVDPDQPITRVTLMEDLVAASAAERGFALTIFQAFALIALLLAATGLYGVVSGDVAQRTRELAIRAALGAERSALTSMVVAEGFRLTAAGIVAGLATAVPASGAIDALLFGVSRLDVFTYAAVVVLHGVVALAACAAPAWRAGRTDPAGALGAE